jgi:hypothetical protein
VKRAIVLALSVILALVVAAPTVLAQEGSPNGVPPGVVRGTLDVEPGDPAWPGTCTFPLQLDLSGKGKLIEHPNGVGLTSISTSPGLDVTITNATPPAPFENQATFNITGSIVTSTNLETGEVTQLFRGRNLIFDAEAGTVIAIGNFSFVSIPAGPQGPEGDIIVQPLKGKGQLIDVCALLA